MHIQRKALRENLPDLLFFIEQACNQYHVSHQIRMDIQLVVEEACVNIIDHGYDGLPPGMIEVTFQPGDHQACVTIVDFGRSFDPTTYPPPDISSEWDQRPVGGLGIFLIKKLMNEVHYTSDPLKGNRLELIKNID